MNQGDPKLYVLPLGKEDSVAYMLRIRKSKPSTEPSNVHLPPRARSSSSHKQNVLTLQKGGKKRARVSGAGVLRRGESLLCLFSFFDCVFFFCFFLFFFCYLMLAITILRRPSVDFWHLTSTTSSFLSLSSASLSLSHTPPDTGFLRLVHDFSITLSTLHSFAPRLMVC